MYFDPDVVRMLEATAALHLPSMAEGSPEKAREMYLDQARRNGGPRVEMASVRDLSATGQAGPIPLRLYRPASAPEAGAPALVFIHGGGYVVGDIDTHDGACRRIADRAGCLVISVAYRLAPEHPAPAAPEDVATALRWIADHAADLGADAGRLAIAGDSAGGGLAAVGAIQARGMNIPLRCQILIYPSIDNRSEAPPYPSRESNRSVPPLTPEVLAWYNRQYLPNPRLGDDWHQSPILAPDKAGLPPALVIVGERDPLRSEGLAYADALEAAGVEVARLDVPGMIHGFIVMSGSIRAADRTIDAIAVELGTRFTRA